MARAIALYREEARQSFERWLDSEARAVAAAARFQSFYDDAPIGYMRLDRSGAIVHLNAIAAQMLGGVSHRSLIGKPLIVFVKRADTPVVLRHLMRCRTGEPVVTSTLRLTRAEAVRVVQLVTTRAFTMSGLQFDTIVTDVSEQAAVEEAVRDSERRYRGIVETANEGICIADQHHRITFVNHRFARMVDAHEARLVGSELWSIIPEEDMPALRARFRRSDFGPGGVQEMRLRRDDGSIIWTIVSTSVIVGATGGSAGVLRMFTDITDRKELEAIQGRLVKHLVAAQEAERRRIALELHDQTGQHLVGLTLGLDRLAQLASTTPETRSIVAQLQEITAGLSRDVHHLAVELRPAALDDLGLATAVSNFADTISTQSSLKVDLHCAVATRLEPAIETTVYRVVQEALTNVVRHASANQVSVIIENQPTQLSVVIEDDGVGFDVGRMLQSNGRGLGIVGMRERATVIGGELKIESSDGKGTTLFLRVPHRGKGMVDHEEAAGTPGR
jgi:PAS domain S-box-containing protein